MSTLIRDTNNKDTIQFVNFDVKLREDPFHHLFGNEHILSMFAPVFYINIHQCDSSILDLIISLNHYTQSQIEKG